MIDIFSKICYNKLTWKFMFGLMRKSPHSVHTFR